MMRQREGEKGMDSQAYGANRVWVWIPYWRIPQKAEKTEATSVHLP